MPTKAEERKALAQIRAIVDALGDILARAKSALEV